MSNCPTDEDIAELIAGRLDDVVQQRVFEHLGGCDACRLLVAAAELPQSNADVLDAGLRAAIGARLDRLIVRGELGNGGAWQPAAVIDEYRLVRPLGRGAVGQVYLAIDTQLDRPVAMKFLAITTNAVTRERFRLEARAVARLSHPNVVAVYRAGESTGRPFLVSEFVQGSSLDKLAKPMPWRQALDIGLGLARGLQAAHEAGVLHRDIKPANLIVTDNGTVKLLDFGLAKIMEASVGVVASTPIGESLGAELELSPSVTATGALLGTPLYMAPEAWRAEPSTPQMDLYSVGAVLHELCVGAAPHTGATVREIRNKALSADVAIVRGAIEPGFASIIERCLRREPLERFASAQELGEALQRLQVAPVGARRRIRLLAGVLLVLALVLGVVGIRQLGSRSARRTPRPAQKCSADGWCWDAAWIGQLSSVWGSARNDYWVVGERGVMLHYDGHAWNRTDSGTVADLHAVHGLTSDDVWAVGDWGTIIHWDGHAWQQVMSGTTAMLTDVLPFDRRDAWAVGLDGGILHWDGSAWHPTPSGTVNGLLHLAASGPHDLWAVGRDGAILHGDGTRWTTSLVTGHLLMSVWCSGRSDVWAVGHSPTIWHWNGKRWSELPAPDVVPPEQRDAFADVWGTSASDVWLMPKRGRLLLHWDGKSWSSADVGTIHEVYRLWGTAPDDIWTEGGQGSVTHWDGHRWTNPDPERPYAEYHAIWAKDPQNILVAGWSADSSEAIGIAVRYDGDKWNPIPLPRVGALQALWGSRQSDVWAAGSRGTLLHWDGEGFAIASSGTSENLNGMWGSSSSDVWVVGDNGTILRRQGEVWLPNSSGTGVGLNAVWGSARDDVWAVGDAGTILRWQGTTWSAIPSGTKSTLHGIWGSSPDDVWAVGEHGTVLRWRGSAWTAVFSDTVEHLLNVGGSGPDDIWAVSYIWQSYHSTLVRWNGKFWSTLERTPRVPLFGLWAFGPDDTWAVGNAGTILHFQPNVR
jgi:hypothetical protein